MDLVFVDRFESSCSRNVRVLCFELWCDSLPEGIRALRSRVRLQAKILTRTNLHEISELMT